MGTQERPRLSAWSRHPLPGTGQALPDRGRRRGRRGGARRVHTGWHTVCLGRHLRAPLVSRSALPNLGADRNEGNSLLRFPQRAVLPFCDLWSVGAEWEYAPPKPTHRLCDASTAGLSSETTCSKFLASRGFVFVLPACSELLRPVCIDLVSLAQLTLEQRKFTDKDFSDSQWFRVVQSDSEWFPFEVYLVKILQKLSLMILKAQPLTQKIVWT